MSRASSASSSPRYSAGLMAQVAAAMAASSGHQVGSPTGAAIQSYIRAHQQQRQQQQASMQSFGQNGGGLAASSGAAHSVSRSSSGTPPRTTFGPQRHVPLAPHVSNWTHQGEPFFERFIRPASPLHFPVAVIMCDLSHRVASLLSGIPLELSHLKLVLNHSTSLDG